MNEARKKYLWSVHGEGGGDWFAGKTRRVEAVVLAWGPGGYGIAQRIPFVAKSRAHANEVAFAAYELWCIAHGEEVEYEQRAVDA